MGKDFDKYLKGQTDERLSLLERRGTNSQAKIQKRAN